MNRYRLYILPALLPLLLLTACVTTGGGPSLDVEPLAQNFDAMPVEAATIVTAVAVQGLTPPLERSGAVAFAEGATGLSEFRLGLMGFDFTGATLYAFTPPQGAASGMTAAEIEYTDPLERKATMLFRAEYVRDGDGYLVNKLEMKKTYTDTPRVRVTIIRASDLPAKPVESYLELISFLADKGLTAEEYASSAKGTYAVIAVGQDWAGPGSELQVAVSAKKTGLSGYKKASRAFLLNEWPVGMAVGAMDPSDTENELYAKVSFKKGDGGLFNPTRLLGVYQLAAFDKKG